MVWNARFDPAKKFKFVYLKDKNNLIQIFYEDLRDDFNLKVMNMNK